MKQVKGACSIGDNSSRVVTHSFMLSKGAGIRIDAVMKAMDEKDLAGESK